MNITQKKMHTHTLGCGLMQISDEPLTNRCYFFTFYVNFFLILFVLWMR